MTDNFRSLRGACRSVVSAKTRDWRRPVDLLLFDVVYLSLVATLCSDSFLSVSGDHNKYDNE